MALPRAYQRTPNARAFGESPGERRFGVIFGEISGRIAGPVLGGLGLVLLLLAIGSGLQTRRFLLRRI
jgi:hypothetical protein